MTLRTVTLNTGFDDAFDVDDVRWGDVSRATSFTSLPAGKGVNLARTASFLGVSPVVYGLVGGDDLALFGGSLETCGLRAELEPVDAPTRHNLTLVAESVADPAAHFVGPGYRLADPGPADRLAVRVAADAVAGDIVTLNGSLPVGVPSTYWKDLATAVLATGAEVVIDIQGEALRQMLGTADLLAAKPNEHECAALPSARGRTGPTIATGALRDLAEGGVAIPMVTLGSQGVAHLVDGRAVRSWCPASARVLVGAGDAFLAGFCVAVVEGDRSPIDLALAAAAAHIQRAPADAFAAVVADRRSYILSELLDEDVVGMT